MSNEDYRSIKKVKKSVTYDREMINTANVLDAIERYSLGSQDTENFAEPIFFNIEILRIGDGISYDPESALFTLSTLGLYQVSFKANANKTDISTPDLALAIERGRSLLMVNTLTQHYVSDTTTVVPLTNTVLINVTSVPDFVRLITVNTNGRYTLPNISITRLS